MEGKRTSGRVAWWTALIALVPLAGARTATPDGSTDEPAAELARGRTLYTTGKSPRGLSLVARIVGGERVPALAFPCLQCHGESGAGALEGGRIVPPITRLALTRPRPRSGGSDARPAYDEPGLARAVLDGLDPAGRELDPAMPRYEMDARDLADLLAYLPVLGRESAPGCDTERVRIGTLLALHGPEAARARGLVRLLEGAFAGWNEAGGIHGRRLELVAADAGDTLDAARDAARRLLDEDGGVLALVAPGDLGAEPELLAELDRLGVPVVGPLGVAPDEPEPGAVFWHLASLADQSRAAARFVASAAGSSGVASLDDGTASAMDMSRVLATELVNLGIEPLRGELTELARDPRPEWLICFGARNAVERALGELRRTDWRPRLLFASVLLGGVPDARGFRFDLLAPAVGPGWSEGGERFEALCARLADGAGAADLAAWRAAYAAAELLAQGLRACGREPTRARLIDQLARVRRLETGVLPPLGYGPALRVGTRASLIVSEDERGALAGVQLVEPAPEVAR